MIEPKLTVVTVTKGRKHWNSYMRHIKRLREIYEHQFKLIILDNSSFEEYLKKVNMFEEFMPSCYIKDTLFYSFDSFIKCRQSQSTFVNTEFMTILDDDDQLVETFLDTFEYLHANYPDADYFNLCKIKKGQKYYPRQKTCVLPSLYDDPSWNYHDEALMWNFYRFDHYSEDKMTKIYPINGYCIFKTALYKKVAQTLTTLVDDCYPMMKLLLEAKQVVNVSLPWQIYETQNNFMYDSDRAEEYDEAFYIQLHELSTEYPGSKLVHLQIENLVKLFKSQFHMDPPKLSSLL